MTDIEHPLSRRLSTQPCEYYHELFTVSLCTVRYGADAQKIAILPQPRVALLLCTVDNHSATILCPSDHSCNLNELPGRAATLVQSRCFCGRGTTVYCNACTVASPSTQYCNLGRIALEITLAGRHRDFMYPGSNLLLARLNPTLQHRSRRCTDYRCTVHCNTRVTWVYPCKPTVWWACLR